MKRAIALIGLAAAAQPAAAIAQTASRASESAVAPPAPAGRTDRILNGVDFDYEISEDSSRASVQIGGFSSETLTDNETVRKVDQNWLVKLAVPIGGGSDLTARDTLDSLANGTELSFSWSAFSFRGAGGGMRSTEFRRAMRDAVNGCLAGADAMPGAIANAAVRGAREALTGGGDLAAIREAARRAAVREGDRLKLPVPDPLIGAVVEALLADLPDHLSGSDTLRGVVDAFARTARAVAQKAVDDATVPDPDNRGIKLPAVKAYCNALQSPPYPDSEFARTYSGWSDARLNRSYRGPVKRIGVTGGIGVKRFEFLDNATLGKLESTKPQFRAALFGAFYPAGGGSALLGRIEYQNAYEESEDGLVCKPVIVDPDADCTPGKDSGPAHVERANLSLEYRQVFEGWKLAAIAISPKATYDTLSNEFALQLPVYLLPRKAEQFSPGFSVSYSSETKHVAFGVFLRAGL